MKIKTLMVVALMGIVATACEKDDVTSQEDMTVKTPITISANYGGHGAKVAYTEEGANITATWETGDELYVVYNGVVDTLTLDEGAGTSSATFTGTVSGTPSATSMLLCYVKDKNAPSAVTVNADGSYTYTSGTFTSQDGTLASAAKCNLYYGVAQYGDGQNISCTFGVNTSMMKFSVVTGLAENSTVTLSYKSDGTTIASANFNVGADGTNIVYMSIPAGKYTGAQTLVCNDGSRDATATLSATQANFSAGETYSKPFVFLFDGTGEITATNGAIIAGTGGSNTHLNIAADATVTLSDVTNTQCNGRDWAGITCLGNATINLNGTNSVRAYNYPGVYAAHNNGAGDEYTLTIQGSGSLDAYSTNAAGIGSYHYSGGRCGNIEIKGGTITSTGGAGETGIGAAYSSQCGNITISGGNVSAKIFYYGAGSAGIGAGYGATCGNITISGGTVTASAYNQGGQAAGIGGSYGSTCGTITITSAVTKVTAIKTGSNFIGAGDNGTCGTVTIDGVTNATTSSSFTHFTSTIDGNTWTLTHN